MDKWAAKRLGAQPPPDDVKVDDLDLDKAAKAQLRSWGKRKPPVPGNPPEWVTDEGAWERAKKEVEKNWGSYSEPWAVVTHVYKNMTGQA